MLERGPEDIVSTHMKGGAKPVLPHPGPHLQKLGRDRAKRASASSSVNPSLEPLLPKGETETHAGEVELRARN